MSDETIPVQNSRDVMAELEKSREAAARLLETLAQKIGVAPGMRGAADGVQRAAQYVHAHSVRDVIGGIEKAARRRPAYAVAIAVVAGFFIGRALRSR